MRLELLAVCATLVLTVACGEDDNAATTVGGVGGTGGSSTSAGGSGGGVELPDTSPKALVRFRGARRLKREMARALELAPNDVCKELGQYECFGIHGVVLGETDAFGAGIYEPLPDTTATSPIAAERIAMAGCVQRAKLDVGSSSAVIFTMPVSDGAIDVDAATTGAAIDTLYRRALGRHAKPSEIEHHRQLYRDIVAAGSSSVPAEHWAALSCFAVLTSMEMLFY